MPAATILPSGSRSLNKISISFGADFQLKTLFISNQLVITALHIARVGTPLLTVPK
jgi:hypothetical protein